MDELLPGFAEHLGLLPDEARPALEAALSAVRRALDEEGAVSLEGIGRFSAGGGFEPDAGLVAAVNDEFAGLEALAEPAPVSVPVVTSFPVVPVAPGPAAAPPDPPPAFVPSTSVAAPSEGQPGRDDTLDADLADAMDTVWMPPPAPPVAPLVTPAFGMRPLEAGDAPPVEDRPHFPIVSPAAPFAATATAEVAAGGDGARSGAWLWALPLVAIVAVGAWLMFMREEPAGADATAEAPAATGNYTDAPPLAAGGGPVDSANAEPAEPDASDGTVPTGTDVDAQAGVETEAPSPAPAVPSAPGAVERPRPPAPAPRRVPAAPRRERATPAPTPRRPPAALEPTIERPPPDAIRLALFGAGPVDPSTGGVTWVLNSTDAPEAAEQAARYRALGFRSNVLTGFVDGRRVHRVAVGQFADVAEARAARHLLPPDAPADTWILRLDRTP